MSDFTNHLIRQLVWSKATFGPGKRTAALLDHLKKELKEVEDSNGSPDEWVDVVILGLEGLMRSFEIDGYLTQGTDDQVLEAVIKLREKQVINESRTWPDWRTADQSKAIEHIEDVGAP